MTNIFDLAQPYTDLLNRTKSGNTAAAKKLLLKLEAEVAASELNWDAKLVLAGILKNIASSSDLQSRVFREQKNKLARNQRDYLLVWNISYLHAYGYSLANESSLYSRVVERLQSLPIPDLKFALFFNHERYHLQELQDQIRGANERKAVEAWKKADRKLNYIAFCFAQRKAAAVVAYFIEKGDSQADAILNSLPVLCLDHTQFENRAHKAISHAWEKFKSQTDAEDIEEVASFFALT